MTLVKANRPEAPDGKYVIGPYNYDVTTQEYKEMVGLGTRRVKNFRYSLAATNGVTVLYTTNDVLVELGALDTSILPDSLGSVTKILIENVFINSTTASGTALVANIWASATSGTATNAAVATGTEIVGAGASYLASGIGTDEDTLTEVDIDLNAAALYIARPNITVDDLLVNLYLSTHTGLNADATAGRGNIRVEYIVL